MSPANYRRYMDEKVLDRLDKLLWEVENLFKETYADLAMLTLLGLQAEDYMAMLEKSDAAHSSKNENSFACKIERAALVLCAIDSTNLLGLAEYADPSHPLATSILKYCQILLDENASPEMLPTRSGSCGGGRFHPALPLRLLRVNPAIRRPGAKPRCKRGNPFEFPGVRNQAAFRLLGLLPKPGSLPTSDYPPQRVN